MGLVVLPSIAGGRGNLRVLIGIRRFGIEVIQRPVRRLETDRQTERLVRRVRPQKLYRFLGQQRRQKTLFAVDDLAKVDRLGKTEPEIELIRRQR